MKKHLDIYSIFLLLIVALSGCEVAGLEFQENEDYKYHVLNPKINMTALEFLNLPRQDTIFRMMQKGVQYAGLTDEYSKPDRTFLFLTNAAILRYDADGTVNKDCFFGKFNVNGVPAKKWEDYPVETVRDLFLYHIIEGAYSYDNLSPDNTITTAIRPTNNSVYMMVVNNRDSKIRINDFPDAIKPVQVRSSNIQATNGIIHALDLFIEYGVK